MQKRWIACALALLMIFGLFACGEKPAAVEQPAQEGENIQNVTQYYDIPGQMDETVARDIAGWMLALEE